MLPYIQFITNIVISRGTTELKVLGSKICRLCLDLPCPRENPVVRNMLAFSLGRCQNLERAIQEQRQLSIEDKRVSQALPCACSSSYTIFFNPEHGYPQKLLHSVAKETSTPHLGNAQFICSDEDAAPSLYSKYQVESSRWDTPQTSYQSWDFFLT